MVVKEYESAVATVRVHDDAYSGAAEQYMVHLGYLVSQHYKRRQLDDQAPAAAAILSDNAGGPKRAII